MKTFLKSVKKIIVLLLFLIVFCGQSFSQPIEEDTKSQDELLFVAQKALEDGFYDVSFGYLDKFLKDFPQSDKIAQAYLLMAQCYLYQNQYLKAIEVLDKILLLPNTENLKDDVFYWKAEVYFRAKDYTRAKNFYNEILSNFPDSEYGADATYSLGWSSFELGDYGEAIKSFNKLIQLYPDNYLIEDAYFKIAESLYNQKEYQKAKEALTFFLGQFPESKKREQAYFFKAESNYYLGDYDSAIVDYRELSGLTENEKLGVLSKTGIGWSNLMKKNYSLAEQAFRDAEKIAKEKNIALDGVILGEASLFSETEKNAEALSLYEELISKFPESSFLLDAYLGKANSLYRQEKYAEALEAYQDLLGRLSWQEDFSDLLEKTYFGIAWTNLKLGRVNEAVKEFQNIINRTQDKIVRVSALSQLGDIYQEMGEFKKAVEVYDNILKEYPDSFYGDYVQYQLAITLLKLEDTDASIMAFQSLKHNYPKSKLLTDSQYYLSLAYFNKGNFNAAKENLQNFINSVDRSHELRPQAMQLLGLTYRQIGNLKESADTFELLTKEYSDNPEIILSSDYEFAVTLFLLGDDKEGLKRLKLLSYNYPKSQAAEDALFYIANYYLKQGEPENAKRYFEKIINEYPSSKSLDIAYYGLGRAYFDDKQFDKSIESFNQIRKMPYSNSLGKADLAIAEAYSKKGEFNSAIKICRDLAIEHPEFARESLVSVGDYFKDLSKYGEALKSYQDALTKDRGTSDLDDANVYFKIAELFEEKNDLDKAIETYLKVAYLSSDNKSVATKSYLRAARIFEDKESWQEAKKIYEKVANENVDEAKFAQERIEWIDTNIKN